MSEKSRLLFLIDDFWGPEGGTEQHLLFLQRELPRDQFDLHFGVLCGIQRLDPAAFPVRPVMLSEAAALAAAAPLAACAAWRGSSERSRPTSSTPSLPPASFMPLWRSSWPDGARSSAAVETSATGILGGAVGRRAVLAAFGAQYAANCEAAREFAAKVEWIPRRRISVIPNPAPSKRWEEGLAQAPSRSSLGLHDGQQVVAMVATVRPIKDHATFLRAARLVLDEHPATHFLAIGRHEPPYFTELQSLADELNIAKQIHWLGAVNNPLSILAHCDVGVLSSQSEGFSNALLDYAVAGIATVATDVGGTPEVVEDGVTGFLVPPRSPEQMADRICQLLRDDALRKAFGARAAARAGALFSEQSVLNQYSQLYQRLAGKTATAVRPSAITVPCGAARVSTRRPVHHDDTHAPDRLDQFRRGTAFGRGRLGRSLAAERRRGADGPRRDGGAMGRSVFARSDFHAVVVKDQEKFLAALPLVRTRLYRVLSASTIPANGWLPTGGGLLLDRGMARTTSWISC